MHFPAESLFAQELIQNNLSFVAGVLKYEVRENFIPVLNSLLSILQSVLITKI